MSIQQPPPEQIDASPRDGKLVRYEDYIDTQIRNTRRMVKAVDVATVLVVTTLAALAFLLTVAVVEHWLVPGGFDTLTRSLLFTVLAGGVGIYLLLRLWPLCVRSINPVYAAQTIEQGSPSLKNSLLNLLLFRQRRGEITDAVYETLESQAAERLVHVPVDAAVDRTHLIRLGYVLVVIVAIAALYKIISPKDPFVAAQRVLMPWADVVPASRVKISNVEPGTTTLSRGEVLEVSAEVWGIGEDDPVLVRYTTADGQAVDRPVQLTPTAAGLRFVGRIPDAATRSASDPIGVAQDLRYRIEAGDARSLEYKVTVVAAPTITIDRIDYEYPDYTGFTDRTVDGIGDIRAIEGTRVTVHARANGPIDEAHAHVDFEADGRRDVRMQVDGSDAAGAFVLALRDDRLTPRFTSYALRYRGTDGRENPDPVKFPIDVLRDYPPEVAILAPREKVLDVRLDETIVLEVEARDPDFTLAEVRLHGEVAGRAVFDEPLLTSNRTGRFTGRLLFTPRDYDLEAGDVVQYWGAAHDNRAPQSNHATSERQTLRVSSPDPNQPPPDRLAQRDPPQQQPGERGGESDSAEGQQSGGEDAPARSEGESASADGDQSGGEDAPARSEGESASADGQQSGGEDAPARSDGESASADGEKQSNDTTGEDGRNDASDGERSPVSSEGDNDGEAFDRIRKFLQREGELPDQEPLSDEGESASAGGEKQPNDRAGEDDRQPSESVAPEDDQSGRSTDSTGEGPGAETKPGDLDSSESDKPTDERDDSQSPGGQQTSSKGPSGAGDQPQQDQGSPDSQPDTKPADKWQQTPSTDERPDDQEPPAGGRGKRESDSQGNQGGDRTGGGDEGGGQQANRDGTGSDGQNQSADEGVGESSEQGRGNTSPDAGQDATAGDRTGQSGDEPGRGSSGREGDGDQSGGQQPFSRDAQRSADSEGDPSFSRDAQRSADSEPGADDGPARSEGESASADGNQQPGQPSQDNRSNEPSDATGSSPTGEAGRLPAGAGPPNRTNSTAPEGDAANLEYARKQTDLVLEKLSEQLKRKQVDKRLLDELGWSEQDLARFLQRWQELKATAEEQTPDGDTARRELDDALRSLGLRRGPLGQSQVRQDDLRNLREGYRGAVPLEYQERLRAYNQGVSRARRDGE